jgi:hypothetical protein
MRLIREVTVELGELSIYLASSSIGRCRIGSLFQEATLVTYTCMPSTRDSRCAVFLGFLIVCRGSSVRAQAANANPLYRMD